MTDGSIIERVLAGDHEQFALLVERYRAALLRFAISRLQRVELAEDAVQETFLCAFISLRSYDSRFSFRTWLWTILLNQCRRHLKRQHRWMTEDKEIVGEDAAFSETVSNRELEPPESALANERLHELEKGLQGLPSAQADALRLRFFGHLKFQEIADAQRCSLSTAKNRVRNGLLSMSELLNSDLSQSVNACDEDSKRSSSERKL